jgi:hypothetical protein
VPSAPTAPLFYRQYQINLSFHYFEQTGWRSITANTPQCWFYISIIEIAISPGDAAIVGFLCNALMDVLEIQYIKEIVARAGIDHVAIAVGVQSGKQTGCFPQLAAHVVEIFTRHMEVLPIDVHSSVPVTIPKKLIRRGFDLNYPSFPEFPFCGRRGPSDVFVSAP